MAKVEPSATDPQQTAVQYGQTPGGLTGRENTVAGLTTEKQLELQQQQQLASAQQHQQLFLVMAPLAQHYQIQAAKGRWHGILSRTSLKV